MNWRDNLHVPHGARLSEEADNLIRGLICDQSDRLGSRNGSEDIKRHPFFTGRIFAVVSAKLGSFSLLTFELCYKCYNRFFKTSHLPPK